MSRIEKEKLIKADIASIENRVRHAFNQGYDLGFKDGKEKAKPLEQESVLDKVRAEIKDWQVDIQDNEYDADKYDFVFERIFEIIDEYKAEKDKK